MLVMDFNCFAEVRYGSGFEWLFCRLHKRRSSKCNIRKISSSSLFILLITRLQYFNSFHSTSYYGRERDRYTIWKRLKSNPYIIIFGKYKILLNIMFNIIFVRKNKGGHVTLVVFGLCKNTMLIWSLIPTASRLEKLWKNSFVCLFSKSFVIR